MLFDSSAGIVNTKLSNGEYLVKGKKVTCFTDHEEGVMKLVEAMPFLLETKLKEHGAEFENAEAWQPCVSVSACGRVATGQNPASATPLAEKIVELLKKQNTFNRFGNLIAGFTVWFLASSVESIYELI